MVLNFSVTKYIKIFPRVEIFGASLRSLLWLPDPQHCRKTWHIRGEFHLYDFRWGIGVWCLRTWVPSRLCYSSLKIKRVRKNVRTGFVFSVFWRCGIQPRAKRLWHWVSRSPGSWAVTRGHQLRLWGFASFAFLTTGLKAVFNGLVISVIKYAIFNTISMILAFMAIAMRNLTESWEMVRFNFCRSQSSRLDLDFFFN